MYNPIWLEGLHRGFDQLPKIISPQALDYLLKCAFKPAKFSGLITRVIFVLKSSEFTLDKLNMDNAIECLQIKSGYMFH